MDVKGTGSFSLGVKSLQLLAQSLFEDCGGERALSLLDALSDLNTLERERAISLFIAVIQRLQSSNERFLSADDRFLKDFEEALYKDLLTSMREASQSAEGDCDKNLANGRNTPRRLTVLEGGRGASAPETNASPLDLDAARRKRLARAARVN